ncbi:hypothetical protein AB0I53_15840 [Saccharopolyspora sp. NPDC050389]|uniref:hypothetical protein n=1 Tax=Saccharopolyspora sp. NPDC050389 TaxID=3155516 RepID=UPI0033C06F1F
MAKEITHDKSATDQYRTMFEECRKDLTSAPEIIALQGAFDILAGQTNEGKLIASEFKRSRENIATQVRNLVLQTLPDLTGKLNLVDKNFESTTEENKEKADGVTVTF